MRHSFKPAPLPVKAAKGKAANGHLDNLSGANPFAETAPSRLAAAKAQSEQRAGRRASISGSSVASSDADEAELGRDIYQDLASFVQNGMSPPSVPFACILPELRRLHHFPQQMTTCTVSGIQINLTYESKYRQI